MSAVEVTVDEKLKITIVGTSYLVAYYDHRTYACELYDRAFFRTDGRSRLPDNVVRLCIEAVINKKIKYYRVDCADGPTLEVQFETSVGDVCFTIGDCRCVIEAYLTTCLV